MQIKILSLSNLMEGVADHGLGLGVNTHSCILLLLLMMMVASTEHTK